MESQNAKQKEIDDYVEKKQAEFGAEQKKLQEVAHKEAELEVQKKALLEHR